MLQATFDRIASAVSADDVFVVTEQSHASDVRLQLPEVPAENFLIEPIRRGTGPAIGWAAVEVQRRDPAGVMTVLPSDHVVVREEEFRSLLEFAGKLAESTDALLTFGIEPAYASTEYGYVHRGAAHSTHGQRQVYAVESFTEKPDVQRARQFVESGAYYWNSGMFCWKASVILAQIERLMPKLYEGLMKIEHDPASLAKVYRQLPKETIDYGVLEKAEHVLVVPADIGWSDVGTWSALREVLAGTEDTNVCVDSGEMLSIDTRNTLVCAPGKLVATIGVEDLVIVDSETALLVCHRDRAGDVRKVVEQLEAGGRDQHL
jgi:mannose-1-phosphate guanylyltransferase